MSYESLLNEIESDGIDVYEIKMEGKAKGYCVDNVIAIDAKIDNSAEKRCTLAEELGHVKLTTGNILNTKKIINLKQEKLARNWAYEKLVGIVDIINAYNSGARNRCELAEYLEVTEDFLLEAINHYKEKYGLYYEIDNYTIMFEPHLGIIKKF